MNNKQNHFTKITVKKAERDAGPKHEGDGKFHHPRRTIGKIRQHQRLGWASLSIWVTEFSVTLVLWSCVTLGFSNSDEMDATPPPT
jgi:hypothetical protein